MCTNGRQEFRKGKDCGVMCKLHMIIIQPRFSGTHNNNIFTQEHFEYTLILRDFL